MSSIDFEIGFSKSFLTDTLLKNGLSLADIKGPFTWLNEVFDDDYTAYFIETDYYQALQRLISAESIDEFFEFINIWANEAIRLSQEGVSIGAMLDQLRKVSFESFLQKRKNAQLHGFFQQVLLEGLQNYQTNQINFILHHDNVTQLPNTQILLERIHEYQQIDVTQPLTLYSIRFLLERNSARFIDTAYAAIHVTITEKLKAILPRQAQLFHSNNLHFEILYLEAHNNSQYHINLAKIVHAFEHVLIINHQALSVVPKVGVCATTEALTGEALIEQTKLALDIAVNSAEFGAYYTESLAIQQNEKLALEADVISAFNSEALTLYFQPLMQVNNEKCVGAEVLLRWPDASKQGYYPSLIIENLNRVGLGKAFTRWLVNSTCRMLNELQTQHDLPIYLSLNLRAEDVNDIELPHLIYQSTKLWQVKPEDILLEITEEGILVYNNLTAETMHQLTAYGFKLALDDFGTGYSSLSRLKTMPISMIKIDQSFVRDIHNSAEDLKIVAMMAQLANGLGKEVLVEGVETAEALALIKELSIAKAQGYYFAKPMPFEQFIDWAKPRV